MKNSRSLRALAMMILGAGGAWSGTILISGDLRTNANVTDCGSGCTLSPADSDGAWAQWAAVEVQFTVSAPSFMDAITYGYAGGTDGNGTPVVAGGLEPYLSLFDASGTFLASTYSGTACPSGAGSVGGSCYDVELDAGLLNPGNYTIVLSAWENMSLAENYGSGTLADGFTGLGNLGANESLAYAFDIKTTSTSSAPEPGLGAAVLAGLIAFGVKSRFR